MSDNMSIVGQLGQCDRPDWEPLLALLGEGLAGEFMWMSQIDLADGTAVHAYKHARTRLYLHVGVDGRTMVFTLSGRYRPVDPYDAIVAAFDGWELLVDDRAEFDVLRAALRMALRKALAR
jgi:hypothetical protein